MSKTGVTKVHAIGGGVVAALGVAGWLLVLHPVAHQRKAFGELVVQWQEAQSRLEAARGEEKAGKESAAAAAAAVAAHPLMLEPATAVNGRLEAVAELAAASGVRVDTIEAGRPDGFGKYAVVPVQLTARGTYVGLHDFFAALHEQMPDMDVASSDVSGRYVEGGGGQSVMLKLRWHTAPADGAGAGR
jgi:hypothetical protein